MADVIDRASERETLDRELALACQRQQRAHPAQSLLHCEACGGEIPEARRRALAGVRRCVDCQQSHELRTKVGAHGH